MALLAGPAERMDPGVDHQPAGAKHLGREVAELLVRVLVEAHLVAQALGVQCPAFAVGDKPGESPKTRQLRQFLCARCLQVMPRHRFVQQQGLHVPFGPRRQVVDVGLEVAGTAAVGSRRSV